MFNRLFRLCRRENPLGKTPLEDFTTEAFASLLKMNTLVRNHFLFHILKLPKEDEYVIYTQQSYPEDYSIIDIVIEGEKNVCFIENKVESSENEGQLSKYIELLYKLKNTKHHLNTRLVYCTKKFEPKEYKDHNFQYLQWHEIAKELRAFEEYPLVNSFLKFLKTHKMTQQSTFTISEFQAIGNLKHTMEMLERNLKANKPLFEKLFTKEKELSIKEDKFGKKYDLNRWVYKIDEIVGNKYSDFIYGFYFDTPSIYVGLYIEKKNEKFLEAKKLKEHLEKTNFSFEIRKYEDGRVHGLVIKLEKDISYLLNNENAENEIKEWFEQSFADFKDFFIDTKHTGWKFL